MRISATTSAESALRAWIAKRFGMDAARDALTALQTSVGNPTHRKALRQWLAESRLDQYLDVDTEPGETEAEPIMFPHAATPHREIGVLYKLGRLSPAQIAATRVSDISVNEETRQIFLLSPQRGRSAVAIPELCGELLVVVKSLLKWGMPHDAAPKDRPPPYRPLIPRVRGTNEPRTRNQIRYSISLCERARIG